MDILRTADQANLGMINTQHKLTKDVKQLSTGLRINTAGDDPSGLAISQTLESRVKGLQEGEYDVKNANNALTTAEGALSTVANILQRMRALVVESNSDLETPADKDLIQKEIDELKKEINTISQNAVFNGRPLLDGTMSAQPAVPQRVVQIAAPPPNIPGGTGLATSDVAVVDPTGVQGPNGPGPLVSNVRMTPGAPTTVFQISVLNYDPNAVDPTTGPTNPPGGMYVRTQAYSDDPTWGPEIDNTQAAQLNVNGTPPPALITGYIAGVPQTNQNGNYTIFYDLSNLTPQDAGASIAFVIYAGQAAGTGQPAQINVGRAEGDLVTASLPEVNDISLGVNNLSVAAPQESTGLPPLPSPVGGDSSNQFVSQYNLVILDNAIDTLGGNRATLGAQMVALQSAGDNAAIDEVNTQASESGVADLNVGQATTSLASDQILVQVQTQVLQQVQAGAKQTATVLSDSIANFGH